MESSVLVKEPTLLIASEKRHPQITSRFSSISQISEEKSIGHHMEEEVDRSFPKAGE
jgi:hypothetical protein